MLRISKRPDDSSDDDHSGTNVVAVTSRPSIDSKAAKSSLGINRLIVSVDIFLNVQ